MRSIWTGSISFGLVNIPVRLYSAVEQKTLTFDLLHKSDGSDIRFARVCKAEEKEVPYSQIIKGFRQDDGSYIELSDEDFKRANVKKTRSIEILGFADPEDFGPSYFVKPYYLEPDNSDKPFALLRDAMKRTGKVAFGSFVLRAREHLVMLKAEGGIFLLNEMRFAQEIRSPAELKSPPATSANAQEAGLALSLINSMTRKFKFEDYEDTYSKDLLNLIRLKSHGTISKRTFRPPRATQSESLMSDLKRSLNSQKVCK